MNVSDPATMKAKQVGRLADPSMDLRTDPRMNPRLRSAMAEFGLDAAAEVPNISRTAPIEKIAEAVGQWDEGNEALYAGVPTGLPGDDKGVTRSTETVPGLDGNDIILHVYRPARAEGPMPCVVYVHGGGMTILQTFNNVHRQWSEDLAATGMVVIGVDFRNAYTAAGLNPFPAGLNDCTNALKWIHANREQLGITKIVLQGESGGANLVLATTLKAKQDGHLDSIDGVYAAVPYISGGYGWSDDRKLKELPSLLENDGYFIECQAMDMLVEIYDPGGKNAENPLCWPYHATDADLAGLPPHVITVDELDPLRDEGVGYFLKLMHAGVPAAGRVNLGITHAAELIFRHAVPEVRDATVIDIKRFADSL